MRSGGDAKAAKVSAAPTAGAAEQARPLQSRPVPAGRLEIAPLAALLALACAMAGVPGRAAPTPEEAMNATGKRYVFLVLQVGMHDADYVDAYYGPPQWREEATAAKPSLERIEEDASALLADLDAMALEGADDLLRLCHRFQRRQLEALQARVGMLQGRRLPFDEESKALYDAVAPRHTEEDFRAVLAELESLLPGEGRLIERLEAFRREVTIPKEKLDAVFARAIAEARERVGGEIELPVGESFRVEYVTDKSWSGYNWYQGDFRSLIQVNTDLPVLIDRALDLACHEGYPGHHVYNALLEKHLVRDRGWQEFTVYPLFSPMSLIAEGSANYGVEVAFPEADRLAFERDVLYPLAGLDPAKAAPYAEIRKLTRRLSYAGNEAARRYLDGETSGEEAAAWLVEYALMSPERAAQRVRFFDQYRSYVINYNLGEDMVAAWVERQGGSAEDPRRRWEIFTELLASPRLPSDLL